MADFFILSFLFLLLFPLGKSCPVRWATEYLHACSVLTPKESVPVGTELSYSVKLLRLNDYFAVSPPLSKYRFPNCVSASAAIVWQETWRRQPAALRKARESYFLVAH